VGAGARGGLSATTEGPLQRVCRRKWENLLMKQNRIREKKKKSPGRIARSEADTRKNMRARVEREQKDPKTRFRAGATAVADEKTRR